MSYIEENKNKRLVLSALIKKPHVWQISKVENTKPLGIIKITLDQDSWDEHTDYVNLETGEMYADYYTSDIAPTDPTEPTPTPSSIMVQSLLLLLLLKLVEVINLTQLYLMKRS